MKSIVQFSLSQDGKYYVAEGVNVPIVTQAKSLKELSGNIREALDLYFEDNSPKKLGFSRRPSVLVNFELPEPTYA